MENAVNTTYEGARRRGALNFRCAGDDAVGKTLHPCTRRSRKMHLDLRSPHGVKSALPTSLVSAMFAGLKKPPMIGP